MQWHGKPDKGRRSGVCSALRGHHEVLCAPLTGLKECLRGLIGMSSLKRECSGPGMPAHGPEQYASSTAAVGTEGAFGQRSTSNWPLHRVS